MLDAGRSSMSIIVRLNDKVMPAPCVIGQFTGSLLSDRKCVRVRKSDYSDVCPGSEQ